MGNKIISVSNPKGGAGKTVTAVNIAYALANKGKKILLVDSDPRAAIKAYMGIDQEKLTLYELIKNSYEDQIEIKLSDYIIEKYGVDIIVSSMIMSKIDRLFELEYDDKQGIFEAITNLTYLFNNYDYAIFDTEGTINNLNTAILNATDYIFLPTKSSNIDLNGVPDIINAFQKVKKRNKKLEIKKVFLVDVNDRTNSFKEAKKEFENYFKDSGIEFSKNYIRHDQNIVNAMKQYKSIFNYKNSSNAAIDYRNLVDEFLESEEK